MEPFAGSLAFLLNKPQVMRECVNDLDGEVVNFWRIVRDDASSLIDLLVATPYAREEYEACRSPLGSTIERARRFFVRANMAFGGIATGKSGFSAGHPRKASKPATFSNKVDALEKVAGRLRNVEIEMCDYKQLIARWESKSTLIYLDPPYAASTRRTGDVYGVDNGTSEFHQELAGLIIHSRSNIMLSGYKTPAYAGLLDAGWKVHEKKMSAPMSSHGVQEKVRIECVYTNY